MTANTLPPRSSSRRAPSSRQQGRDAAATATSARWSAASHRRRWRRGGGSFARRAVAPPSDLERPGILVVSAVGDPLARTVALLLADADIPVLHVVPEGLAELEYETHMGRVYVAGMPLRGLVLRSGCPDSAGPLRDDFSYSPSVMASWLAIASAPSVRAVNYYDAGAWTSGCGWPHWAKRLSGAGVRLYSYDDLGFGGDIQVSVVACGAVVSGPETKAVKDAAEVLQADGVRLATVTTLTNGGVADVNTQPAIVDPATARRAAVRITNYLAA